MEIRRGGKLTADMVRGIANAARGASQFHATGGRSTGGPLGQTFSPDRQVAFPPIVVNMHCEDVGIPAFGVVEYEDCSGPITQQLPKCYKVRRHWTSRVGIALAPTSDKKGSVIPVQVAGMQLVIMPDLLANAGETLGAVKNTVEAMRLDGGNQGGPFKVVAVSDNLVNGLAYALVLITHTRLDWQSYTDFYGGDIAQGDFQVLIVKPPYYVTLEQPGVVTIGDMT